VYNGSRYLHECLNSALHQTYPNCEIIAVDDGSSDSSLEILRGYGPAVHVIRQQNSGPAGARHRGIQASSGDFIALLDQDDLWDRDKVEKQLAVFRRYPEALAVYCDHRSIDEDGEIIGNSGALKYPRASGDILRYMIQGALVLSASLVMLRRSAYDLAGGFDVRHAHWTDDFDLWMRIAALGPFLYQLETLVSYRRHSQNTSGSSFEMSTGLSQAFRNLESFLTERQLHLSLYPLVRDARFKAEIACAWHHRNRSEGASAIWRYREALRIRPLSIKAWLGLVLSLAALGSRTRENKIAQRLTGQA
jgi:glycosyltransferase involved in cell wall biosynthesis